MNNASGAEISERRLFSFKRADRDRQYLQFATGARRPGSNVDGALRRPRLGLASSCRGCMSLCIRGFALWATVLIRVDAVDTTFGSLDYTRFRNVIFEQQSL